MPINSWVSMILPFYSKATNNGRPRKNLEILLRMYIVKMCYNLSDEAVEDELYESISVRNFCGISEDSDIPDHTSIWRFVQLLTQNNLQQKMFEEQVNQLIIGKKIIRKGSHIDSTIVDTPSSKRNKNSESDPTSKWTAKGKNYRHGKKIHIGVDDDSGLVHSCVAKPANEHDLSAVEECLHGDEEFMMGDSAYLNAENHSEKAKKCKRHIMKRRTSVKKMSPHKQERRRRLEQAIASKRAKVEHVFGIIKGIFGFRYTRKWGMENFEGSMYFLCAMANIYKMTRTKKACLC